MCKVQVSVMVANNSEKDRALAKLKKFPGTPTPKFSKGVLTMIVDHPKELSVLQAAAWAKEVFGFDSTLQPSARVLA